MEVEAILANGVNGCFTCELQINDLPPFGLNVWKKVNCAKILSLEEYESLKYSKFSECIFHN